MPTTKEDKLAIEIIDICCESKITEEEIGAILVRLLWAFPLFKKLTPEERLRTIIKGFQHMYKYEVGTKLDGEKKCQKK